MLDECLPMGCLPSRSTSVSPIESSSSSSSSSMGRQANNLKGKTTKDVKSKQNGLKKVSSIDQEHPKDNLSDSGTTVIQKKLVNIGTSFDYTEKQSTNSGNKSINNDDGADEDIMSIIMDERVGDRSNHENKRLERDKMDDLELNNEEGNVESDMINFKGDESSPQVLDENGMLEREEDTMSTNNILDPNNMSRSNQGDSNENSFDDELNLDLLRQYIAVDFEISQLEDRDALRLYHEKIEQLEQLESELDMISFEAEEVAVRSETGLMQFDRGNSPNVMNKSNVDSKVDIESNSMLSGATSSMSPKSSTRNGQKILSNQQAANGLIQPTTMRGKQQIRKENVANNDTSSHTSRQASDSRFIKERNLSYSTIEDVFNRKIILEKERDKLKKEVELVIIECDKLQQKYKKRDEILDKLFDGRTGNGLENHLEQQLNWLMEQKHYVDQVFYAWKRAETLTSQTCEQFASALELLKRLLKVQDDKQRGELAMSISNLLIKSRQDMEQAQRYNPNVDAPFFTDAETERFDKIIETIQSSSISQSEYSQMATVVQFAYKRAVSIRLWLEQILQITIARDSFELAEEYKWIAIQLRKERISLINSKLQDLPYRTMAKTIREQLSQQQQQQQQQQQLLNNNSRQANTSGVVTNGPRQNEINRDSGVESDDIDIEEDIYKLLEMNKSRLEAAVVASKEAGLPQATALDPSGRPINLDSLELKRTLGGDQFSNINSMNDKLIQQITDTSTITANSSTSSSAQRDQIMRERVQRRVRGEQPLATSTKSTPPMPPLPSANDDDVLIASFANHPMDEDLSRSNINRNSLDNQTGSETSSTPSRLRVQLNEESRQSILKQVDQMHSKHISKLDDLRGNNRAKASDSLMNRLQKPRLEIVTGNGRSK